MENDEPPNPSDILLLHLVAVMPKPHALANQVKQSPFRHAVIARELLTVYRCSAACKYRQIPMRPPAYMAKMQHFITVLSASNNS
jgi:hypothetical protein